MRTHRALLASSLCIVALVACTGGTSATTTGPAPLHYPAFTPEVPQLQKGALSPMTRPELAPIYFAGETLQAELDIGLSSWIQSTSFDALGEYGVQSARVGTPIVVGLKLDARVTCDGTETWLADQLDGTHPEYGPVDKATLASKIFVAFGPPGAEFTYGGARGCTDFASYDAGLTLATGAVAHYVVVPRCAPPRGMTQAKATLLATTASIIDRIGNPNPSLNGTGDTGWAGFDGAAGNGGFGFAGGGLASACSLAVASFDAPSPMPRVWSNAAAAAYHDPCVPTPSGAYFVSVPVAEDVVTLPTGDSAMGVLVPVGGTRTIDVHLLSDGPTPGNWSVSTQLLGNSGFSFRWDTPVGMDGDTLHLLITAPNPPRQDVVVIYSTRDERRSFWLLPLQSE